MPSAEPFKFIDDAITYRQNGRESINSGADAITAPVDPNMLPTDSITHHGSRCPLQTAAFHIITNTSSSDRAQPAHSQLPRDTQRPPDQSFSCEQHPLE